MVSSLGTILDHHIFTVRDYCWLFSPALGFSSLVEVNLLCWEFRGHPSDISLPGDVWSDLDQVDLLLRVLKNFANGVIKPYCACMANGIFRRLWGFEKCLFFA